MASGQSSTGADPRKGNTSFFSSSPPSTSNARTIKTSIPDLISEENQIEEDDEVDIIRLAQHRPYMQQHQHYSRSKDRQYRNSNCTVSSNVNTSTSSSNITNKGCETISRVSALGPAKRRRLLVAVVIPTPKRLTHERLEPLSTTLGHESLQEVSVVAQPATDTPLAKKTVKFFNQAQKATLEAHFLVNPTPTRDEKVNISLEVGESLARIDNWFKARRQKARIYDEGTSSAGSTPSTSPTVSPAPSGSGTDSDEDLGHRKKNSTSTHSNYRVIHNDKMDNAELLRRIAPLLRGGSISDLSGIDPLVELMSDSNEANGRKIILNALLSTQNPEILERSYSSWPEHGGFLFIRSEGLNIIRRWIDDARNNPENPKHQEILLTIIRVLKALPFDSKTLKGSLKGAIVLIVGDGDRTHGMGYLQCLWVSQLPRFKRSPSSSGHTQFTFEAPARSEKNRITSDMENNQPRHNSSRPVQIHSAVAPNGPLGTINFDPLSSQHNRAMEALRKQQKKSKTVRFKEGEDLVSIRIFERDSSGDESTKVEGGTDIFDDHGPSYSYPEDISPSQSHFQITPSTVHLPTVRHFLMPESIMQDFIDGVFWTPPWPLDVVYEPDLNDDLPAIANGEDSTEKHHQAEREAQVRPAVYRSLSDIPLSPAEPDSEADINQASPKQIPLFSRETDHVSLLLQTLTNVYQMVVKNSHHL
ncbi:hypothetical protein BGX27_005448 [Mortierella sp. AM989]|nr:hypothetical protein BGX27_005448 [Mortierella sp. AM989]